MIGAQGESWYPRCEILLRATLDDGTNGPGSDVAAHVTPLSATINFTPYTEPDTWSVTFDAKTFPFPPRLCRRVEVAIYMWAAASVDEDWRAAINGDHLMVAGRLNDRGRRRFSREGRIYEMNGTDFTAELARAKWDPARRLNVNGKHLVGAVQGLVNEVRTVKLNVVYLGREDGLFLGPRIQQGGVVTSRTKKRKSKKPPPTIVRAEGMAVKQGRSYWDVVFQLCVENGHVAYIQGNDLVITTHANQRLTAEERPDMRFFGWGQNIHDLEEDRDFSVDEVQQQVAVIWDNAARKTVEVRYPATAQRAENHVLVLLPSGANTAEKATAYLREKFEMQAKGEMRVTFSTSSSRDLKDRNILSGLRSGSPVSLREEGFDNDLRLMTVEQRFQTLVHKMGFGDKVALKIATAYEALAETERTLYVRESSFTWSNTEGIKVEKCECINYAHPGREKALSDAPMNLGAA